MFMEKIAPKKFLCNFSLRTGAQATAIWNMCIFVILMIAGIILSVDFKACQRCPEYTWKAAHALCINYTVFTCVMFLLNVWLIWGIWKEKSTVVLSWAVISAFWLFQGIILLIILILLTTDNVVLLSWQLSLSFTLLFICLNIYMWFIGYGFYLELRGGTADKN